MNYVDMSVWELRRERFYEVFEREMRRDMVKAQAVEERFRMAYAGAGMDGEDMSVEPIPAKERSAKIDEPGYDSKLNHETRRRRYASKFHKNIYSRWKDGEDKRLKIAADMYLACQEAANGSYSFGSYDDSPPPAFYSPRTFPNLRRAEAAETLAFAEAYVGKKYARIIHAATMKNMTLAQIWAAENPLGKKSKRTAYRRGGELVDGAFDKLSEFFSGERAKTAA